MVEWFDCRIVNLLMIFATQNFITIKQSNHSTIKQKIKMKKYLILIILIAGFAFQAEAGNPDRQGQAGAYELLLNPWARSAGLYGVGIGHVRGIEALRINPAGLVGVTRTELNVAHTFYLQGSDIGLNGLGIGQRISKNGVIGLTLMAVDFGEIPVTTVNQPEGVGVTYEPLYFNLGIGYAHAFSERISVGFTTRLISEQSTSDVSAAGFCFDAGIQYQTGGLRIGISLRNIGTPIKMKGTGFAFSTNSPPSNLNPASGNDAYTAETRIKAFDLPSVFNIGGGYDFKFAETQRISIMAAFVSNSFTKDQFGAGLEYAFNEMFMVRVGYRYEDGLLDDATRTNVHTGIAAGATIQVPFGKNSDSNIGIDYSYKTTSPFNGTHAIGIRLGI